MNFTRFTVTLRFALKRECIFSVLGRVTTTIKNHQKPSNTIKRLFWAKKPSKTIKMKVLATGKPSKTIKMGSGVIKLAKIAVTMLQDLLWNCWTFQKIRHLVQRVNLIYL